MVKRQLSLDEKRLCEKSVKQLEKRNSFIQPKIEYYDYMISKGLHINYEEKLQEFIGIKKEIIQEIYTNNLKFVQLRDQIQNGVEEIESKTNFCNQCGQEIKPMEEEKHG